MLESRPAPPADLLVRGAHVLDPREGIDATLDVLVRAELQRRAEARAAKDWATADAVRDRLAEAGIEVTDTPDGAQWALKGEA